jgi:hypothetical protein
MFDFLKIKQTIASLAGELKKLRAEREALLQKREELEGAPACKSDLLRVLDDWVDRQGASFPAKLEAGVNYYRRHPLATLPESSKAPTTPMAILTACADPNGIATLASVEASLFYLLGDAIKKGMRAAIETWDFTAAGPPRTERLATIAAIDVRIDGLDKAEQELISQAEASGLKL